jgi:hypothetical protein
MTGVAVAGAEPTAFAWTQAVVARRVLLSPLEGVGAAGTPVNVGLSTLALPLTAATAAAAAVEAALADAAAVAAASAACCALAAAAAGSA